MNLVRSDGVASEKLEVRAPRVFLAELPFFGSAAH